LELQAARVQDYFAHAAELGWFCSPKPAHASDCSPFQVATRSSEGRR
jgi:hypothetical protein